MNQETTPIHNIIKEQLDKLSESQLNIASECAREHVTNLIADKVNTHVNQLMEDIICPSANRTSDGEVRLW